MGFGERANVASRRAAAARPERVLSATRAAPFAQQALRKLRQKKKCRQGKADDDHDPRNQRVPVDGRLGCMPALSLVVVHVGAYAHELKMTSPKARRMPPPPADGRGRTMLLRGDRRLFSEAGRFHLSDTVGDDLGQSDDRLR